MQAETRTTLEYFVEKAHELKESRFAEHITQKGLSLNMHMSAEKPISFTSEIPDTEAIKALTLTLRFFVQDNEPVSLRNVQQFVDHPSMSDAGLSLNWKNQYAATRKAINDYLDGNISLYLSSPNGPVPVIRKEIWEALLWGDYAHSTKRAEFLKWKELPLFPLIQFEYINIMMTLYRAIQYIADVTEMELSGLEVPSLTDVRQTLEE